MAAHTNLSTGLLQSAESLAATTEKWWYLPALSGVSATVLHLGYTFTSTPEWALETFVVMMLLPTTILAVPAIVFDILNKYDDTVPPGLFVYPPAFMIAAFLGTIPLVAVTVSYLAMWVWLN